MASWKERREEKPRTGGAAFLGETIDVQFFVKVVKTQKDRTEKKNALISFRKIYYCIRCNVFLMKEFLSEVVTYCLPWID